MKVNTELYVELLQEEVLRLREYIKAQNQERIREMTTKEKLDQINVDKDRFTPATFKEVEKFIGHANASFEKLR
jgi:hypothetical protein